MNQKNKAVFLDRDGTIIRHGRDFLTDIKHMRLLPGVARAIAQINQMGFLVIVITNQAVISRGIITEEEVVKLHDALIARLAEKYARIDDVFFCPHHPDAQSKKYGKVCSCRKPAPGMLLKAIKKWNIDTRKSFMIGDAIIDCLAGARAGVHTIQVKTGPGHQRLDKMYPEVQPDYLAKNLCSAARYIAKKNAAL